LIGLFFQLDWFNPTVSHPRTRFLLIWSFVALQAMTPFIHAHADGMSFSHTGFLHVYEDLPGEVTSPELAADQHGMAVEVAHGMPPRIGAAVTANETRSALVQWPTLADQALRPGSGLTAPPRLQRVPPAHVRPFALAPPLA
jgi:hypothetical protein